SRSSVSWSRPRQTTKRCSVSGSSSHCRKKRFIAVTCRPHSTTVSIVKRESSVRSSEDSRFTIETVVECGLQVTAIKRFFRQCDDEPLTEQRFVVWRGRDHETLLRL